MVRFRWFTGVLLAAVLGAQTDSRIGEILAEREQKARTLAPDRPDGVEQQLIRFREGRVWERLTEGTAGLRVKFGGLVQGSGFALGPEYQYDFAGGRATLRGAIAGAEEWVARCLIERRDKIGAAYYRRLLPIDRFEVRGNRLVWQDLGSGAGPYVVRWFRFDNRTGESEPAAVDNLNDGQYYLARITGSRRGQTVEVYLRSGKVVGVERARM